MIVVRYRIGLSKGYMSTAMIVARPSSALLGCRSLSRLLDRAQSPPFGKPRGSTTAFPWVA